MVERSSKNKENTQWKEPFNKVPYPNESKQMTSGVKTRKCSVCGKSLHLPILSTNPSSYTQGTNNERQICREKAYKHGGCGKAFIYLDFKNSSEATNTAKSLEMKGV